MTRLAEAGKLNRRVTIERAGVASWNGHGDPVPAAPVMTERWASITPVPGTERFANAENAASAPKRFVFRYEASLVQVTDTLIDEDGRRFDIKSVDEIGFREGLEVLALARAEVVT